MPDLEISQLDYLAGSGIQADDVLALADLSASQTKKVKAKELVAQGLALADNNSIPPTALQYPLTASQIITATIADSAVTNNKLQNSSFSFGGLTVSLGSTDATPALDLTDATNYPTSSLSGTITNAQLAGSIANSKLADNNISLAGVNIGLGGTYATPAFDLTSAINYPTSSLTGTITNAQLAGSIENSKLVNSSMTIGGVSISLGVTTATPAFDLTSATNYPTSSLTGTITNDQLAGSIANSKLSNSSISVGGVSLTLGSTTATPAFDLSSAINYAASNLSGTITNAQLAGSIANNKLTNSSITLGGVAISLGGSDATPAFNLSDSTGYLTSNLSGTITNAQLAGSIAGTKLLNSTITSTQLATNSVTSIELSDNSVDTAAIASLAVTDAKIASGIAGSKITDGTILPVKLSASNLDRSINVSGNNLGINNSPVGGAASRNGITYNSEGLITSTSALVPSDLPEAEVSNIGAVSVPVAGGLSVTALGALSISNSITAATVSGFTFNSFGQITATQALVGSDLPVSSTTALGAVKVPTASAPITVDGNGVLSLVDSGVASGTYGKVTVSSKGIVTSAGSLVANDIPAIPASKVSSGTFGTAFIADDAVTMDKLASNAISFIQEAQPDISNLPSGVYWLQESTGQLRIFNGNSWYAVGFGRLAEENLRYAGTFDGTSGVIGTLTTFGVSAGLTAGTALPAGTAALTGIYAVCTVAGSGTSVVSGVSFTVGDWAICNGLVGWQRVDINAGDAPTIGLDDLNNVTISTATAGQFLELQAGGSWTNVSEIVGGTY